MSSVVDEERSDFDFGNGSFLERCGSSGDRHAISMIVGKICSASYANGARGSREYDAATDRNRLTGSPSAQSLGAKIGGTAGLLGSLHPATQCGKY